MGAGPLKSRQGLYILGLDADPCIIELVLFCFASTMFLNFEHFIIYELLCNLRIYVITLLFGLC
jgi:hypothetical protein